MKRNETASLSEGPPNIWINAKLINYHYGLLMVTDDGDYNILLIINFYCIINLCQIILAT